MNRTPYIFRDGFSPEKANNYIMLLQVFPESFSFAVTEQKELIAFGKNIPVTELSKPDTYRDVLTAGYSKTVIGLPATAFTLLPRELFKQNGVLDVARFLDVKNTEAVFSQPLNEDNEIVYKTSGELIKTINSRLNLQSAVFGERGWITLLGENYPSDNKIYLDIYPDKVHVLNFRNRKLRFYNAFEFENKDELVYFVASAVKELGFEQNEAELVLNGDFKNANDSEVAYLSEFFEHVEINKLTPDLNLPAHVAAHEVLSVAALSKCVS